MVQRPQKALRTQPPDFFGIQQLFTTPENNRLASYCLSKIMQKVHQWACKRVTFRWMGWSLPLRTRSTGSARLARGGLFPWRQNLVRYGGHWRQDSVERHTHGSLLNLRCTPVHPIKAALSSFRPTFEGHYLGFDDGWDNLDRIEYMSNSPFQYVAQSTIGCYIVKLKSGLKFNFS